MSRVSSAKLLVRKNLFRKSIRRRKFSFSSSDVLNVNSVVTVFDPNKYEAEETTKVKLMMITSCGQFGLRDRWA